MYAVLFLVNILQVHCSVLAPAVAAAPVAVPGIRYGLVAPQNVRPFAAQVSTFTRGLNVYAAPYAAGVIGGPAIVPAPAVASAPVYPEAVSTSFYPAAYPAVAPAAVPAVASGGWAPAGSVAAPAHLLPAPFARSVHAVAPGLVPALGSPFSAPEYLG